MSRPLLKHFGYLLLRAFSGVYNFEFTTHGFCTLGYYGYIKTLVRPKMEYNLKLEQQSSEARIASLLCDVLRCYV